MLHAPATGRITRGVAILVGALLAVTAVGYATPAHAAEGNPTVVSLTFDDSNADQLAAVNALNAAGLDGTFYTVSSYIGSPGYLSLGDLNAMKAAGHEIGGHTVSHADLTTQNYDDAKRQVCMDRATLSGWGFAVTSFAYPYAAVNDLAEQVVADCGYNSGRGLGDIQSRFGCSDCDFAETIPPTDHFYTRAADQVDSSWTMQDLQNFVTNAESTGGWLQLTFHHVCDGCDSLSISPSLFSQFAQWLAERSTTHNTVVKTVGQVIGGSVKPVVAPPMPPAPGPGVNGLTNPGLEEVGSNGVPSCWMQGGFGSNSPSFSLATPGRSGNIAQRLTMTGLSSGDAKLLTTFDLGGCSPTVTAGHSYDLRTWYQSNAPTQFAVYLRNSVGLWSYWTSSPWFEESPVYRQAAWTTGALPAGTTGISFGLSLFQNGELLTDDYELYDSAGAPAPLLPLTKAWPWLGGTEKVGNTLTANYSAEWGPGTVTVEHQWLRNGAPISGATGVSYTLVGEDAGATISVRATGTRDGYNPETTYSAASGTIAPGDLVPGTPTIGGMLKVGHTVTADAGTWGPDPVALSYQWKRNGTEISGATAASYALVGDDMHTTISVDVTGTKLGYITQTLSATGVTLVEEGDLTVETPTIDGVAKVGVALTAIPGAWGPSAVNLDYQWMRNGVNISGATDVSYTPTVGDRGSTITVQVTGSLYGYGTEVLYSLGTAPVLDGDLIAPVPTISGTAVVGETLTVEPGAWGPDPVSLSYQWFRNGTALEGETTTQYTLGALDNGAVFTVSVTGTKFGYITATQTSDPTASVTPGALAPGSPSISGTAQVGQTLSADLGTWGPGAVTLSVQWMRGAAPISGAASADYTVVAADVGHQLTVRVTGVKAGYTTTTVESDPTAVVATGIMTAGDPSITGTLRVGQTLQAHPGSWQPDGVSFAYQWLRDGVAITGATASGYLLRIDDLGASMTVTVTATLAGYDTASATADDSPLVAEGMLQAQAPSISGTAAVGGTLTATTPAWGPDPVALSHQWLRDGAPIAGATGIDYTVTDADAGHAISVAVTGTKPGYETTTRTSPTLTIAGADTPGDGPVAVTPTISGEPAVGETLHAIPGDWGSNVTLRYQWLRGSSAIRAATAQDYTLTPRDQGTLIRVRVTAHQAGFDPVRATSAPTDRIALGTIETGIPTLSGTLDGTVQVGTRVTVTPGSWGPAPVTLSYQWLRDGTAIRGATHASYTPKRVDAGHELYVVVTGKKTGYATATASPIGGPVAVEPRDLITQAIEDLGVGDLVSTPDEQGGPGPSGPIGIAIVVIAALLGAGWLVRRVRARL